jgi:two-component system response regulator DesR
MSDEDLRLRVLVVDDHDVVQWGFRVLLERQPWVERCLAAQNAEEALARAAEDKPHVALVDLFLGSESGADICADLLGVSPQTNILLISGAGSISPAAARSAGASGFVSKDMGAPDVVKAVRMVGLGMEVFASAPDPAQAPLSVREREVVSLISAGATNREIAERLFLSPHTIKEYTSGIYKKLGVRNRAEAVKQAQHLGLIA